ncbi:type IV toxin-antitoxin system AbiEi family antitoxin domain-containing protein [[Eubacterium] cellulosolvens]
MKEREFLEIARALPIFTTKQISAIIGDMRYTKVYLHRLLKKGLIQRVKRGFYTIHEDPIIFATHIYYPSYISLWYAFQHYGTTTQLPLTIEVMTHRNDSVQNVNFIKTRHLWGYHRIKYMSFEVFISDLEKAIIDAVTTGRVPLDEIQCAISKCDIDKLEEYTMRMNISTMKKIGFIAESTGFFMENLYFTIKDDRNYVHFYAAKEGNKWRLTSD